MSGIISTDGEELRSHVPAVKAVHPTASRVLIEIIEARELIKTELHLPEGTAADDGAPQAYIIELGPGVPEECEYKVGQRVYWEGKGTPVQDPRGTPNRLRALLEFSNIKALIEEE
jgi:hypothetical protein